MTLWVQYQRTGTIVFDLPERPDASPTYVIKSPSGASLETGTGSVNAVNTTLNGAVSAGATSVVVTSATGITAGRRYLIGGAVETGGEWVTVKSVSGTTVTLVRDVITAKASGAAFQSTRVECAVSATGSAAIGRHHRCELTYLVSTAARDIATQTFDVTRYSLTSFTTIESMRDLDPLIAKRLPAGIWLPTFLDRAWDMITARIATQKDPGALVGAIDLTVPHTYMCRVLLAELAGDDYAKTREMLAKRFLEEFDATLGAHAFDDDQDGAIESNEGFKRTLIIGRG